MDRRPANKTVTDLFVSGKEIDAAVRRAVRQAVGKKPKSASRTGKKTTSARRRKAA